MSLSRKLVGANETLKAGKILTYGIFMIFTGIVISVNAFANDPSEAFSYGPIQVNSVLAGFFLAVGGILSIKIAFVWAKAVEKLFE